MNKIQQIEVILDSIKKSYSTLDNQQLINSLMKIPTDDLQFLSKRIIQFLFNHNFVILNAQSTNSLRHYIPKDLNNKLEFITNLKEFFKLINIDIKTVELSTNKTPTYFYFKNFKEIIIEIFISFGKSSESLHKLLK